MPSERGIAPARHVAAIVGASMLGLVIVESFARLVPTVLPLAARYELGLAKANRRIDPDGHRVEEYVNVLDQVTWHATLRDRGFRDLPTDDASKRPVGAVVGDSMSFCWGVNASDCWVTHLGQAAGEPFTDLGLPGTGSLSHYEVLRDHLTHASPRIVLWQFFVNDFNDDWETIAASRHRALGSRGPGAWLLRSHAFLQRHSATYALVKVVKNRAAIVDAGGLSYVLRPAWIYNLTRTFTDLASPEVAAGLEASMDSLDRAVALTREHNARLIVVIAPSKERVYWQRLQALPVWPKDFDPGRADAVIKDFCRQRGIAVLDLFDVLRDAASRRTDLYFRYDDHWTPAGNAVVADRISEYLSHDGLLATN